MKTKKIIQISSGSTYDEVRHLLNSPEWRIMDTEELMECNDCKHQAREYAEHDDVIEVGGVPLIECNDKIKKRVKEGTEEEVCCQVRCPNCKSWYYWEPCILKK